MILVLRVGGGYDGAVQAWIIIGLALGALIYREVREAVAFSRLLHELRSLDRGDRSDVLARILDAQVRERLAAHVARDPVNPSVPPVDRFSFPQSLRQSTLITYWIAILVAAGLIISAILWTPAVTPAIVLVFAALVLAGYAWWLHRRIPYLDSTLEISPFAISEVYPDGSRRTLLWRDAHWLINRRRSRRLDVTTANVRERIQVHYQRLEFYRAVKLVIEYGGFRPGDTAT